MTSSRNNDTETMIEKSIKLRDDRLDANYASWNSCLSCLSWRLAILNN